MPWKETDAMNERVAFVVRAVGDRGDDSMAALCREFGISRKTGYKWLNRYREVGRFGLLAEKSRRPHHSPKRIHPDIEQRVVELRKELDWGGHKLARVLRREGLEVSPATIDRIIARRGLTFPHSSSEPATRRFERSCPNELWQMDFKGEYPLRNGGCCYPLSVLDDHSRFALGLHALPNQKTASVRRCLIATWERYGMPQAMLLDHGTPWWSPTNGHGLTKLSVFLLQQDIRLIYSGIAHPQTQGKVERFHRSLKRTLGYRGVPETLPGFQDALHRFRQEYNELRGHESLDLDVPAQRYQPSSRSYDPKPRSWEYPPGSEVYRLNSAGCLDYHRYRFFVCEALAGQRVRCELADHKVLVSFRQTYIREIDLVTRKTTPMILAQTKPKKA